jgi:hypothetical protein
MVSRHQEVRTALENLALSRDRMQDRQRQREQNIAYISATIESLSGMSRLGT